MKGANKNGERRKRLREGKEEEEQEGRSSMEVMNLFNDFTEILGINNVVKTWKVGDLNRIEIEQHLFLVPNIGSACICTLHQCRFD